jgi:hypothetical protein
MLLTPEQDALLLALPSERAHATSVADLARALGRDERAVRDDIKLLRETCNMAIVALPTRRSVFLARTPEDLEAVIACQQSRLDSLARSISRLKRLRDAMAYQPCLFRSE